MFFDSEKMKKELSESKVRDLYKKATSLGIKGAWDMKKSEVIDSIIGVMVSEVMDGSEQGLDEPEEAEVKMDIKGKLEYVNNVSIGTLVAFNAPDGRVRSAKVMKKSTRKRKLMVETEYGASFVISFDDVIWVKTGSRWPRGVYNMLKGNKNG